MVAAGSLGVSALVCLLNNDDDGRASTTANLMGPFWRAGSPHTPSGGSIVRSPTPGDPVFVTAWVHDRDGPAGARRRSRRVARVARRLLREPGSGAGRHEPARPFTTDANGHFAFRTSSRPATRSRCSGPVGDLLRAQGRHNMRPAHLHFLIHKPGFKTQFSQVYSSDDPHLETDVAVRRHARAGRRTTSVTTVPAARRPAM